MILFPYNIFAYHMGLVELEITLQKGEEPGETWYTDLLPVLIQPSQQQENLKAMVEYIYAHQAPLCGIKPRRAPARTAGTGSRISCPS